ncbi:MAG: transposase [Nitrospirales bacterium]
MSPRQNFTSEFKREAVQLLESGSRPADQIARELGIRRNQLYKWQAELKTHTKSWRFRGQVVGRTPEKGASLLLHCQANVIPCLPSLY